MEKNIEVKCECEGTGFIAVADSGGDGIEHVECAQHHPSFEGALSVDELLAHIGKQTGITIDLFKPAKLNKEQHKALAEQIAEDEGLEDDSD